MIRFLLFIFVFTGGIVFAQQSAQFSQYVRNQYMINPGATGVYDFTDITLGGRWQWVGLEDSPKTSYIYFSTPVKKVRNGRMKRTYGKVQRNNKTVKHPTMRIGKFAHAFGGHVLVDQFGAFRSLKFMGTYAVHIPMTRSYSLSLGVNAGLQNRSFLADKAQVLTVLEGESTFDQTYNVFANNQGAQNTLDIESGIYFYSKELFVGLSANQLTSDLVKFGNTTTAFSPKVHFFFTGGYKFQVKPNLSVTPAFIAKYVIGAPVSIEGTVQGDYKERFWFGVSYRHRDALVGMVGATLSNIFKVGYSYDFSISKLNRHTLGGHELVLGIMLGRNTTGTARF